MRSLGGGGGSESKRLREKCCRNRHTGETASLASKKGEKLKVSECDEECDSMLGIEQV